MSWNEDGMKMGLLLGHEAVQGELLIVVIRTTHSSSPTPLTKMDIF